MVKDIVAQGGSVAYLSTPSLFYSVEEDDRKTSYVFDFDKKWEYDPNFVFYDFNKPDELPDNLLNTFDLAVVDPPFIVREVWEKYAISCKKLLKTGNDSNGKPNGKVILTTVNENYDMLKELYGDDLIMHAFMPSIPNLVYQYNLYTNYESEVFNNKNPEIPDFD